MLARLFKTRRCSTAEWLGKGQPTPFDKVLNGRGAWRQIQALASGVGHAGQVWQAIRNRSRQGLFTEEATTLLGDMDSASPEERAAMHGQLGVLVDRVFGEWKRAELDKVKQAVRSALDSGTSTAFRLIKKEGKVSLKEAGKAGSVKTLAI